jgi:hypothetical protein
MNLKKYNKMSFQSYIDNILKNTDKSIGDFEKIAEQKGILPNGELTVKATTIIHRLKLDIELGQGHAMAIYATLNNKTE